MKALEEFSPRVRHKKHSIMWKITNNINWSAIREEFEWIRDMEGVPQDPIFHAEGDVAIHTRMVLEQLQQLEEYQALAPQRQHILFAAALLHDVEKRSTTVIEPNGRITSRKHALKGETTSRKILYQSIPTPFGIREAIAKLVRYHGLPIWVLEKHDPQKALLKASLELDTQELYILAKADVLGRICKDQSELLDKVELFKEYCIEQNCWGQAYPFASDAARFTYFYKSDSPIEYVPFEKETFEVVLMSGLPGSGKDTYIQNHYSDLPVISLDAIRKELGILPSNSRGTGKVVHLATERAKVFLRQKQAFLWNATNLTVQLRAKLIRLFATYKASVKIVYVEVPFQILMEQNRDREEVVPIKVIEKMLGRWGVPSRTEVHEVVYCV